MAYVRDLAQRLEARGRLGATRSFIQHGDVSVYDHCLLYTSAAELRHELDYHAYRYYMLDAPEITDAAFDKMLVELQEIESAYPDLITPTSYTVSYTHLDVYKRQGPVWPKLPRLTVCDPYELLKCTL